MQLRILDVSFNARECLITVTFLLDSQDDDFHRTLILSCDQFSHSHGRDHETHDNIIYAMCIGEDLADV